jgi:Zn-dependent protease with chaperone function/uncharacterized tellurite resistance protein B-like protein
MATDFFERQSAARRSTKWLVVTFTLSVVALVGAVTAITGAIVVANSETDPAQLYGIPLAAGGVTLAIVLLGSLYKVAALNGGGTTVAESVGGKRIHTNTNDPVEKRVLNVVEEMAIASGVPVPPVYLLDKEQGINAFAAGYSPSDAVVTVTRGTAEQLTREQLQGVVAHEFSHILHGDMRLNIRLIGVLHGILLLGLIGRILFRIAAQSGRGRSSKNNPAPYLFLVGLALVILGFLGTVLGGIIKASISRQREYLADASAVQFTRNPLGIAGALKRIGAAIFGSKVKHPNAAEVSHMYFSQGVWEGLTGLTATHPPLRKRIEALDPEWDGTFPPLPETPSAFIEIAGAAGLVGDSFRSKTVPVDVVEHADEQVGRPTELHRSYAEELVSRLPREVVAAVHEPYGARAVVFALLLDDDPAVRLVQMASLRRLMPPDVVKVTEQLLPAVDGSDLRARLPLVDMALPALRSMTTAQYQQFTRAFQEMVAADHRLSLFEWTLHRVLLRHLRPQYETAKPVRVAYYSLARLSGPCSVLLSAMAYTGNLARDEPAALAAAAKHLPKTRIEFLPRDQCGLQQLDAALTELARVSPKLRRQLVEACAKAVCADDKVKIREAELLRGICDMLDCPMSPLLAGQPVVS